jgi:DNA repair exonuclease SbcCD ATPase subunit
MRMAVTLLRDRAAELRAKEKAEAPTVKTEEQMKHEAAQKEKQAAKDKAAQKEASTSVWKRKFRPLPEAKAVDLFADVIGDSFILLVAGGLILYEYLRAKGKPDLNAERIAELNKKLEELDTREGELEEAEKQQKSRVETLEQAIEEMRKTTGKKKSLSVS